MQKIKNHLDVFFMLLVLAIFGVACSSDAVVTPPEAEGVTIARRNVSLLTPTSTDAGVIVVVPAVTSTLETPLAPPTETPTVPQPRPSDTPSITNTLLPTDMPATSTPTASPEPEVCQGGVNLSLESAIISAINQERTNAGLPVLTSQAQLTEVARLHAEDMACNDFFSHESPTNGGVVARVTDVGYSFSSVGEVIAAGYSDAEAVVAGWMDSPTHRSNILNPDFTQIGAGYATWDDSSYGAYWVVVFGKPGP